MDGQIVNLVIAEDHATTSSGLQVVLESVPNWRVVQTVIDGRDVMDALARNGPDVLILDLLLPGRDGLSILEFLTSFPTRPKVVIFSGQTQAVGFAKAYDLGADALVSKAGDPANIIAAVEAALSVGPCYISPEVELLLGSVSQSGLTPRELQVLVLMADGVSNPGIGEALAISTGTAKKHRENLMRKLGASNAVEATRTAIDKGLL